MFLNKNYIGKIQPAYTPKITIFPTHPTIQLTSQWSYAVCNL